MKQLPKCQTLVILDIEYTAWEGSQERGWSEPWEEMEVIQIAMLAVDRETLEPIDHFTCLVKPQINPQLSDYIQKLTGITQGQVDRDGVSLLEAFILSNEYIAKQLGPVQIISNGNDGELLSLNGELVDVNCPTIFQTGISVRPYLEKNIPNARPGQCSGDLANLVGRPLEGHKHNALYDVHSIAVALRYIKETIEFESEKIFQPVA